MVQGDNVQCRKKPSGQQGFAGFFKQDGYRVAPLIPEYGTELFYYRRGAGDGQSSGDAGGGSRN